MGASRWSAGRAVLEEVNRILIDRAARRIPGAQKPADRPGPPPRQPDLFGRLGPYLPDRIDPDRIDWNAAGFDFDSPSEDPPRWRRPPEDRT